MTGAFFAEFAFALAGAVTVSGIVALTLSPMMCSRLLKAPDPEHGGPEARLTDFIDRRFHRLRGGYERWLHSSLNTLPVTAGVRHDRAGQHLLFVQQRQAELAPTEDQGIIITSNRSPRRTQRCSSRQLYSRQACHTFVHHPETEHVFQLDVPGESLAGMVFKPWDQRSAHDQSRSNRFSNRN